MKSQVEWSWTTVEYCRVT